MPTIYQITEVLGDGLVGVTSQHGRQLWAKVRLRKFTACVKCRRDLPTKTEAFSPIGNGMNRADRLCLRCVAGLISEKARV